MKNEAITIAQLRVLLGNEEFKKKTVQEWMIWIRELEVMADSMIEEITGSKYQTTIERIESMLDNMR